ncbi:phage baseplate protein [Cronobacter sakazakii]|uniref:phage baseplate protein n=2 Tax=Cronobacter sakazakii TaxID=28141 RepID=UPI000B4B8886|nr:hypothetical protein [Cronobacter sakazakii]EJQ2005490.1 hypothetical protein [Cronobacter sakazakii]EJQ2086604.1 hypothetical protein [Cronobacter sakazakii]EJR9310278.1 hypothetical protein [Cronobacter sakazakii]EJR9314904.1 hypothetical protein [Cronobacter sakazakii]EJR9319929.1 hypothetical protein [Cronobacter sakazakii]
MDFLSTLLRNNQRRIGVLVPDVVISESHKDTLNVTSHPVEFGAAIADHAWRSPATLIIKCGFGSGGALLDFASDATAWCQLGKGPQEIYLALRDLLDPPELLDVVTGKRIYQNMLLTSIDVMTDATTEYVLSCTLTLTEVIISHRENVQVATKSQMKSGVLTTGVTNSGVKSTVPVSAGRLSAVKGG